MILEWLGLDRLGSTPSGTKNPRQWLVDWISGDPTFSGEQVNEATALSVGAVRACVSLIAEAVATLPLHVYERLRDGDKQRAVDHPVDRLLSNQPNPDCSAFTWREALMGHLLTYGNAYAEVDWSLLPDIPAHLWLRSPHPSKTKPIRQDDGSLAYELRNEHGHLEATAPAKDMLHVPGLGFDGVMGYSVVQHGRQSIGIAKGVDRYVGDFLARDCKPGGIISVPDYLKPESYERTKASFNQNDERHRIQLLEGGATYAAVQLSPADVQLVEARRLSVEDVCRLFHVPLPLVQLYTSGMGYSSVVELNRAFAVYTLSPWLRRLEAELNRKILRPPYFCEFSTQALMQADHQARGEYYRTLVSAGVMTINEVRRLENLNAIGPEGDRRLYPLNSIPADRVDDYFDSKIAKNTTPSPSGSAPGSSGDLARHQADMRLLADVFRRSIGREIGGAKRAARRPDSFMRELTSFYDRHSEWLAETLWPVVSSVVAGGARPFGTTDIETIVSTLVRRHVAESKEALLTAAECLPHQLADAVQKVTSDWKEHRSTTPSLDTDYAD